MVDTLTARQHAAIAAWWSRLRTRQAALAEFEAAGFLVGFSCVGWAQLRQLLPDMAEVLGRSILTRHRLRA